MNTTVIIEPVERRGGRERGRKGGEEGEREERRERGRRGEGGEEGGREERGREMRSICNAHLCCTIMLHGGILTCVLQKKIPCPDPIGDPPKNYYLSYNDCTS